MINRKELGIKAGNAVFKKYGTNHYKKMNLISQKKRLGHLTKEEKSEYFRNVRLGVKVSA